MALSLWTGFTFVGYFTPIQVLGGEVLSLALGPWQMFWIFFYGFATYGNAGWMREQVCKYMCPYARFQGAMFDQDTLIIAYDRERGEPRGARGKKADPKALGLGDLRRLQHLRAGLPHRHRHPRRPAVRVHRLRGLHRRLRPGDGEDGLPEGAHPLLHRARHAGARGGRRDREARFVRPRTLVYTAILATVVVAGAVALWMRVPLKVDVIRDRGAMVREVEDGELENVYRLQVMNATESAHRYRIAVEGLHGIRVASEAVIEMAPASTRAFPVRIRVPGAEAKGGSQKIVISVTAEDASGPPGAREGRLPLARARKGIERHDRRPDRPTRRASPGTASPGPGSSWPGPAWWWSPASPRR